MYKSKTWREYEEERQDKILIEKLKMLGAKLLLGAVLTVAFIGAAKVHGFVMSL